MLKMSSHLHDTVKMAKSWVKMGVRKERRRENIDQTEVNSVEPLQA